jgi:hypothetical protein
MIIVTLPWPHSCVNVRPDPEKDVRPLSLPRGYTGIHPTHFTVFGDPRTERRRAA